MFCSRTDVIPENIKEAHKKITKAIHQDGYIVMWKILQENHPVFQTAGNNTLWKKYNASEPITTFILSYQAHIAQEAKKHRNYGHLEMLANIHCELSSRTFRLTKDRIGEVLRDYSDNDLYSIPVEWKTDHFDTTIKKLTTQLKEDTGHKTDDREYKRDRDSRINAISDRVIDDEDLGGYEICDDELTSSVNYTNQRRSFRRRSPSRQRSYQNKYGYRKNDRNNNNRYDSYRNRSFSRGSDRSTSRQRLSTNNKK